MTERSKRHHYLPQLYLRAFASEQTRVATFDRRDGHPFVQSVENAAAENHYNTTRAVDGTSSDAAERSISEFEGMWAPALQRVREGDWLADPTIKVHLAHFLAFQYLRVPRQRSAADQRATFGARLELAVGGPRLIREEMEQAGLTPTDADVRAEWDRKKQFDKLEIEQSTDQHLLTQFALIQRLALMMDVGYRWSVIRWERPALLTSDDPMVLWPAPGHPRWSGIGFATAGWIQFAVDRHTSLLLSNRSDLEARGISDAVDRNGVPGTIHLARQFNGQVASHARRFVFHHPEDKWSDLLGVGYILPPARAEVLETDSTVALRDKFVMAHEWALANPDEPHPLARLRSVSMPPSDARPFAIDGYSRRARDMYDRLEAAEPPIGP